MRVNDVRVRLARAEDVAPWMSLAREIEPLFGPMPDFPLYIERGISRGTALVAEDPDGRFVGAALLSRDGQPHRIHWLAVRSGARRSGAGSALLVAIIDRWSDGEAIDVITFGDDSPGGIPARALYSAHGFAFAEHTDNGPEGGRRERWIRN